MTYQQIVTIRPAQAQDAIRLTELAIQSKAYWPYDSSFIELCKGDLTISPERAASGSVFVAQDGDRIVGFYSFDSSNDPPEMNNLFVLPELIGRGVGFQLWSHAIEFARSKGCDHYVMDADPYAAEKFYYKMGCYKIGEVESTVLKDRLIPKLRFDIPKSDSDHIYLTPYVSRWPDLATKEMAAIRNVLPEINFEIEHIGSTAIPGLAAKPIIDLLIGVAHLSDAAQFIEPLEKLGYSYWRDNPKKDHFYFVKGLPLAGGKGRTHHVHLYQIDHHEIKQRLLFRDYLRAHPESLRAYSDLKSDLARKFPNDREAYTSGKTEFVNSILKLAKEEPSSKHLSLVQSLWELHKNLIFHRYLANHVYFSTGAEGDLVVRLTPATHRNENEVVAEVSFMDYLAHKEFPLAIPIASKNGRLVEKIEFDDKLFFATVFQKIEGLRATDEESLEPEFLFNWGAYLAQLHMHSIKYGKSEHLEYRRSEWDFDAVKVKATSFAKIMGGLASARLHECIDWLSQLEKGVENYGLTHGDLHRGNFFVVKGKIVSFDYDDSCFHWFLYDLAASLSTVLKLSKDEHDREQIITIFFDGYESIRPFSKRWKDRFEAFYQYRLALVFNWMSAMIAEGRFSSATIENWKGVEPWYLENMKRPTIFS